MAPSTAPGTRIDFFEDRLQYVCSPGEVRNCTAHPAKGTNKLLEVSASSGKRHRAKGIRAPRVEDNYICRQVATAKLGLACEKFTLSSMQKEASLWHILKNE
jgi:hypothetical protein